MERITLAQIHDKFFMLFDERGTGTSQIISYQIKGAREGGLH